MIVTTTNLRQAPAGTVLHVVGELDTFAADELRAHLRRLPDEAQGMLVVDLSAVTFLSCAALRILAEAQARLGSRLVLGGRSRSVTRLLDITGLTPFFAVLPANGSGPHERDGAADGGPLRLSEAGSRTWTFSRTDVHRARGLLMAVHGCDADQAWNMLARAAARHDVPVGELVELLIRPDRGDGSPPSSASAVAALTVLMRQPHDSAADDADPSDAAAGPDRPTERLRNI